MSYVTLISITEQLVSFQNSIRVLSQLCQGKVKRFSHFKYIRGQRNMWPARYELSGSA